MWITNLAGAAVKPAVEVKAGTGLGKEMGRWVARGPVGAQEDGEVTGKWDLCHLNVMSLFGAQRRE